MEPTNKKKILEISQKAIMAVPQTAMYSTDIKNALIIYKTLLEYWTLDYIKEATNIAKILCFYVCGMYERDGLEKPKELDDFFQGEDG